MFDKIENIRRTTFSFPASRFIEYEESDLEWAVPLGYAIVAEIIDEKKRNGESLGYSISCSDFSNKFEHSQLITKHEILSTSIISNPNSTWKPKWNPELVG